MIVLNIIISESDSTKIIATYQVKVIQQSQQTGKRKFNEQY